MPKTATKVADALDHGMVSINHFGIALPETPFGGVKDSGYGHEGGIEGLNADLQTEICQSSWISVVRKAAGPSTMSSLGLKDQRRVGV